MRKIILVLGVLVAAAVGVSLSTLKGRVDQFDGATATLVSGQKVRLQADQSALSLWPRPAVEVRGVRVLEPEADPGAALAASSRLLLRPCWLPMLIGRGCVGTVEIDAPTVVVERRLPRWLVGVPAATLPSSARVHLRSARFEFVDSLRRPPARTALGPFDATVSTSGAATQIGVRGAILGEASNGSLEASLRPGAGPTGGTQLELRATLDDGDPDVLARLFPPVEGLLDGNLELQIGGSGFVGEHSTEAAPAEPLELDVQGSTELVVMGHHAPLTFTARASIDDRRYQIRKGSGHWGEIPFGVAGWRATGSPQKLNLRLLAEQLDLQTALSEFGVPEPWRPRTTVTGNLRMSDDGDGLRYRYEARAPSLVWRPRPSLLVEADDISVSGVLRTVNADVSASFNVGKLRVAGAWFSQVRFGGKYWRDKLQMSTVGLPLWGGIVTLSGAYYPKEEGRIEAGGIIEDVDVAELLRNLLPEASVQLDGRLDALFEGGRDSRGDWGSGRVGLYRGSLGPGGLVREVLDAVARYARHTRMLDPALVATYVEALSEARLSFDRLALDFQLREDGVVVRGVELGSRDVFVRAEGLIDAERRLAGWGTITFSPALTGALVQRLRDLGPLVGGDARLRMPFSFGAEPGQGLHAEPGDPFLAALDRVARGDRTGPFVPLVPEGSIEMDMPTLEEQFGR